MWRLIASLLLLAILLASTSADTLVTLDVTDTDPLSAMAIVQKLQGSYAKLGLDITEVKLLTLDPNTPVSATTSGRTSSTATSGSTTRPHHSERPLHPHGDLRSRHSLLTWCFVILALALALALVLYAVQRLRYARHNTLVYHHPEQMTRTTKLGAMLCLMLLLVPTPSLALRRSYDNCKVLNADLDYRLYWNAPTTQSGNNVLEMAMEARAQGWLGVGISSSAKIGSLMDSAGLGSDVAIGWRSEAECPQGCVRDYWSTEHEMPALDRSQNVTLVSSTLDEQRLSIEFNRNMDTRGTIEDEDLNVVRKGKQMIIYAANTDDVPTNGGSQLSYHGKYRGGMLLDFSAPSACDRTYRNEKISIKMASSFSSFDPTNFITRLSSALSVPFERFAFVQADEPDFTCLDCEIDEWRFPNVPLNPAMGQTNYICVDFEFPVNSTYHAIRFDPIINALSSPVVHHMILFSLLEPTGHTPLTEAWDCANMPGQVAPLFVWAVGGSSFLPPQNVGFRVGKEAVVYATLQIHFNNPSLGSWMDASGVRIYRTPHLREHNAGWSFMGKDLYSISLPPAIAYPNESLTVSGKCPPDQVNDWTQHGDVHMFAYVMHAHLLGRKIATDHWRDGKRVQQYSNDPYSFSYQHAVMGSWDIKPGDWLNTTCWYDSMSRDQVTVGGLASTDEMCIAAVAFWCDDPCPLLWTGRGCVEWDDSDSHENGDDNAKDGSSLKKRSRAAPRLGMGHH